MGKGETAIGREYGISRSTLNKIGFEQFMRSTELARRILINEYMRRKKP
jgi:hypothetical protein